MNGYTPRYYISATGLVNFSYNRGEDEEAPEQFTVQRFTIQISNEKGDVTYTQVEDLKINAQDTKDSCVFMEGKLSTLKVNGIENITLDNLDDNNRLYFPVKYVAENGVFISNTLRSGKQNYDFWEQKNYLLTQPLGSKVYKIDYDSSLGLPYIEFPSDIANIIESGLTVRYIVSSGINGNVTAGALNKIISPSEFLMVDGVEVSTDYLTLGNPSSILNGKNPETIDEMYQSFKKVVGTFDTLVTCKDFQNAIYMMTDDNNVKVVSNDIVTDIKTDYNKSIRVVSYDQYGAFFKNVALSKGLGRLKFQSAKPDEPEIGDMIIEDGTVKWYSPKEKWENLDSISYDDFVDASVSITPFDICVYALQTFSMSDYYPAPRQANALNKSFKAVKENAGAFDDAYDIIRGELDELKCINHQFNTPETGDVICFKNYVPLNITITPYSKVTKQEKDEILNSIYKALSENFNASMLDFGEELNYDVVYDVIVNSDDRIKSIRLEDFEYHPVALMYPGQTAEDEIPLYEDSALFLDLVAKNVLAGRICLFRYDDDFDYQYGQVGSTTWDNVVDITSEVFIPLDVEDRGYEPGSESDGTEEELIIQTLNLGEEKDNSWNGYIINSNEYVQIAWPNYFTDITYPAYVYYRFEAEENGETGERVSIPANREHTLQSGEFLTLSWNQNNEEQVKQYGPGEVIKPNFLLVPTQDSAYYSKQDITGQTKPFDLLTSNEQIEHRVLLETVLDGKNVPVYWIRNSSNGSANKLFDNPSDTEVMLNSGDYFIYSNPTLDSMVVFGAGTLIQREPGDTQNWNFENTVNINAINKEGFAAGMEWQWRDFSRYNLRIKEMNLLTLSAGDELYISNAIDLNKINQLVPGEENIDNEWRLIQCLDLSAEGWSSGVGCIKYRLGTDQKGTESTLDSNLSYRIRSRLDMTSDRFVPQPLYANQEIRGRYTEGQGVETFYIKGLDSSESDANLVYYQVNTDLDLLGDSYQDLIALDSDYDWKVRSFTYASPKVTSKVESSESSEEPEFKELEVINGNVYVPMEYEVAVAEIPFAYENDFNSLSTDVREYVFPVFIDTSQTQGEEIKVYAYVTGTLSPNTDYKLELYGKDSTDITIEDSEGQQMLEFLHGGFYLLKLNVTAPFDESSESSEQTEETVHVSGTLTLNLEWNASEKIQQYITVMGFKIVDGLNENIPPELATLDDVMSKIKELIGKSNDSTVSPFLTYEPELSMAIQNENLADPTTLWDKNNVANPFTIAQIDLENSDIDIIKSMKNYRD